MRDKRITGEQFARNCYAIGSGSALLWLVALLMEAVHGR